MTRTLTPLLAALLLATAPMAYAAPVNEAAAPASSAEEKVVYHINDSMRIASRRLAQRKNHLEASKDAQHRRRHPRQGHRFSVDGRKADKDGNPYDLRCRN